MTQENNSSVINAEIVNHIPTFDEVYAMAYIQDSIRSLLVSNSRNYPMMASYEDDIRQEMLIYLARALESFSPEKSDIKTYCRMALVIGLRRARREYFTETQKVISMAVPIDKLLYAEQCEHGLSVSAGCRMQTSLCASTPFMDSEKREAFNSAFSALPAKEKIIAKAIMSGMSFTEIWNTGICSHRYLYNHALPQMRKIFREIL